MSDPSIGQLLVGFLSDTIYLAGLPLAVATVAALVVAILQAMTQIQDQNLSQTVKIVAIVATLLIMGPTLVKPLLLRSEQAYSSLHRY